MDTMNITVKDSPHCVVLAKYLGPTNHRGSRIKVWSEGRPGDTITVDWDHCKDHGTNVSEAIDKWLRLAEWEGTWVVGHGPVTSYAVRVGA